MLNVARYDVFQLPLAMLGGDAARVRKTMAGLEAEGEAIPLVLWAITEELRTLIRVKAQVQSGRPFSMAARENRLWGPRERLVERLLPRLSVPALAAGLERAAQIDRLAKGLRAPESDSDPWLELTDLALSIAAMSAAPSRHPMTASAAPRSSDRVAQQFDGDLAAYMTFVGRTARAAAARIAAASGAAKDSALRHAARLIQERRDLLKAANGLDVERARRNGLEPAMVDRLTLNDRAITQMIEGLDQVDAAAGPDRRDPRSEAAPERHPRGPHARPAGRHRHHLREPPERDDRRGRADDQERQRGDPARRFGGDREQPPARGHRARGADRSRAARRRGAARRHHRPRRGGTARRHARVRRHHRAPRRARA